MNAEISGPKKAYRIGMYNHSQGFYELFTG